MSIGPVAGVGTPPPTVAGAGGKEAGETPGVADHDGDVDGAAEQAPAAAASSTDVSASGARAARLDVKA
jgi:hypothetical protein